MPSRLPSLSAHCLILSSPLASKVSSCPGSNQVWAGESSQKQLVPTEGCRGSHTAEGAQLPAGLNRQAGPQPRIPRGWQPGGVESGRAALKPWPLMAAFPSSLASICFVLPSCLQNRIVILTPQGCLGDGG